MLTDNTGGVTADIIRQLLYRLVGVRVAASVKVLGDVQLCHLGRRGFVEDGTGQRVVVALKGSSVRVAEIDLFYSHNQSGSTYQIPNTLLRYNIHDGSSTDLALLEYGNGTAVTQAGLYTSELDDTGGDVRIRILDRDSGEEISAFESNANIYDFGGSVDVAANNTNVATTHNEHLFIYRNSGESVATIDGLDIFSQDVTMNSDRVYVIDGVSVRSYDLNGGRHGNLSSGPVDWYSIEAIEATDKRLYVVTSKSFSSPEYQAHIYGRSVTRDEEGGLLSEQYSYQKTIDFSMTARWYPLSIGANRLSALTALH